MNHDEKIIRAAGMCICDDEGCKLFPRNFWQTFWVCMFAIVGLFVVFAGAFAGVYWAYLKYKGLA